MATTIGTSHFVNKRAANTYYRPYGYLAADVSRKISEGEIHIGRPEAPAGAPSARIYSDRDGRYFIEVKDAPAAPAAPAKPVRTSLAPDPIPQVDGFEGRKRGAHVDWHTGNVSGKTSRSINAVEHSKTFQRIDDAMGAAIGALQKRFAERYLRAMRDMLAPYNTSRHRVTICAGMGACHIDVDGRTISEWEGPRRGVYLLLSEMAQALDWDWASWLNGERLN